METLTFKPLSVFQAKELGPLLQTSTLSEFEMQLVILPGLFELRNWTH
jgi:hypothetical protein